MWNLITAKVDVIEIIRVLLYHYGLFQVGPDAEDDPTHLRRFYGARLARHLVERPSLRRLLRRLRQFHVATLITFIFVHSAIVNPMGAFVYRHDTMALVENLYCMAACFLGIAGLGELYLHQAEAKVFLQTLDDLSRVDVITGQRFRKQLRWINTIGYRLLVIATLVTMAVVVCVLVLFVYFEAIPQRKLFFRGWYPWDVMSSPNYELTLLFQAFFFFLASYTLPQLACYIAITLAINWGHHTILHDRVRNIRRHTILRLRESAKMDRRRRGPSSQTTTPSAAGNAGGNCTNGPAMRGHGYRRGYNVAHSTHDDSEEAVTIEVDDPGVGDVVGVGTGYEARSAEGGRRSNWASLRTGTSRQARQRAFRRPPQRLFEQHQGGVDAASVEGGGGHGRQDVADTVRFKEVLDRRMIYELARLVDLHVTLHRLNTMAQDRQNWMAVVQTILYIAGAGGSVLFVFSAEKIGPRELTVAAVYIVFVAIEFISHLVADIIKDQSGEVGEAVYHCDWIETSTAFKKTMLIVMTMANVPFEFKPTGLDPFSVQQFTSLTNQAYKMVATLKQIVTR